MKQISFLKPTYLFLALLLLAALVVAPAAAQEPQAAAGDVGAQAAELDGGILWAPNPITVPTGGGKAVSRLFVDGAVQVWGFTLSIGYDAAVLTPQLGPIDIKAGPVVPGVKGSDYFIPNPVIQNAAAVPGHCANALGAVTPSFFEVSLVYVSNAGPIEGSGNLIEIPWRSIAGGPMTHVCLDDTRSIVVDQAGLGPSIGLIPDLDVNLGPNPAQFRVGLQGGKPSGMGAIGLGCPAGFRIPFANQVTTVPALVNNICAGPPFTFEAFPGPLGQILVSRPGYLDVEVNYPLPADVDTIYMLAGDADSDNEVTILDITIIANNLGQTYNYGINFGSPLVESIDYIRDGLIDIRDLVLAARNFGASGPTDGTIYDL